MQIRKVSFFKSASKVFECPKEGLFEVAVIWRSNVWKSSLINMLMGQGVAKASDKPGKTQLINYFLVNDEWYFVDLPGYWYAKSSLENRRNWIDETYNYFVERNPLVLLLIDWSIPPQKIDMEFMSELDKENLSFFIVVTKIDKANQKSISKNIKLLKQEIVKYIGYEPNIFLSSAVKKIGREQILWAIEEYM